MRNLTIKRNKTVVGCAMKLQVCVVDGVGSIEINGMRCSRLGTLKNGEEKTFSIGNEQTQIYVIVDRLSKGYCNESYTIPEGQEDVFLSGKNHFNPGGGNPFYFDGQTSPEVLAKRKKNSRKGTLILALCVFLGGLAGLVAGFAGEQAQNGKASQTPKTFSAEGLQITLTADFKDADYEGFTVGYESRDVGVLAIKESFSLVEGFGDLTLEEYQALVLESNSAAGMQAKNKDGVSYFEHRWINPQTNVTYYYVTTTHKGPDAFWLLQFFTVDEKAAEYLPDFLTWAQSVTFTE